MNVIQFAAQGAQLITRAEVPEDKLEELRKDLRLEVSLRASEAYMSYDDGGGITITLIFRGRGEVNN